VRLHVHLFLLLHGFQSMLAHMRSHFVTTSATRSSEAGFGGKLRGAPALLRGLAFKPGRLGAFRHAAAVYAARGWAVVPGAYAVDGGGSRSPFPQDGRTSSLVPLPRRWEEAATTDATQIARWWARHAWVILLPTGGHVEVVEMPADLGKVVVDRLQTRVGPIAVEADQRWLVFCSAAPGTVTTSDDEWRAGVLLHSTGSWVPVPSIRRPRNGLSWLRPPWFCEWRLPHTSDVLAAARGEAVPPVPIAQQRSVTA